MIIGRTPFHPVRANEQGNVSTLVSVLVPTHSGAEANESWIRDGRLCYSKLAPPTLFAGNDAARL